MLQTLKLFMGIFAILFIKLILSLTVSLVYILYTVTRKPVAYIARIVDSQDKK